MTEMQTPLPEQSAPTEHIVDMGALLAEISARLITVGHLPHPTTEPATAERRDDLQLLVFRIGKLRYAFDISHIREVVHSPAVTRIPGLPDWVLGVTNLHGDIMSVVDLARFLSLKGASHPRTMLVTKAADQQIGLMVDEVDLIYGLAAERIISPPFTVEGALVPYLRGAIEHNNEFIRLLECNRLLLGQQMQQFS